VVLSEVGHAGRIESEGQEAMDDAVITQRGGQVVTTWVAQSNKWRTYATRYIAMSADMQETR
jgi:hypothetical protein